MMYIRHPLSILHYLKIRTFSKIWELDTVKMSTNLIKKAKIKTIMYEENLQRIS